MSDALSDALGERTIRLILVHGTWGRGFFSRAIEPTVVLSEEAACESDKRRRRLRWFEPGCEFREKLANGLRGEGINFTTRLLLWNGHNSIASRHEAALVLADAIKALAGERPDDPIVVIAHSHGGNVALLAVDMAGTNCTRNLKVVTLATPFVQVHAQAAFEQGKDETSALGDGVLGFLSRSWATILGAPILIGLMWLAVHYGNAMPALLQPDGSIFHVMMVTVALAVVVLGFRLSRAPMNLAVDPRPASSREQGRHDAGQCGWTGKPERLAKLSQYPVAPANRNWLLVLRGVDDEASLSLAAGAIGNRVAHFILGRALPAAHNALATICGFVPIVAAAGWFWGMDISIIFLVIAFGFAAVVLLVVTIFFLPGIFLSVYGRELLFGSWRCEIAANSSPDGSSGIEVRTLPVPSEPSERKLRHALYMNPEAPRSILAWLKAGAQRDAGR